MSVIVKESPRPEPWLQYRRRVRSRIVRPLLYIDWIARWAAWFLSQWAVLEVLEYCGTLGILVGVIFYFAGARDRLEQKHYQAWQVINTAQGKGGSGGRIDALQDLNTDHIPLVGVDLSGAFLQGVDLPNAKLRRANLSAADMRNANLRTANLEDTSMVYTNLRGADLREARLGGLTDLTGADLTGAELGGADLNQVTLDQADLRNADLAGIQNWQSIKSIKLANILGCKGAPAGFVEWATAKGAVQLASDDQWTSQIAATRASTK
ncbi:MAG TPA: pentapeptide repeat-containing protein [Tepidisphaeraceae bacterium]|jgi:hypothetical protein|nr:pentapeptide repeat-containing protein [Tepidisphaeraceae bacterium]